ncbi:hypothetical protein OBBRIDRAFT_484751 [Obba rivulosa]|uniref:Uncharacterized protein n=1 Tax=Obba rivulosa TaxID=1052685 RepID=A0A8E2AVZ9_9APHY|nr:hypothetical protein OBBRIDRAFT_484751 [Obba rivulosa]
MKAFRTVSRFSLMTGRVLMQGPQQFAPRACSTKGCMELVPPESRWSRCATCGLQKWRKLRDRMVNGYASASKTSAASKGKEQEGPPNRNPPDAKRPSLGDRNSSSRILDIPMAPNLTLVENATDISTSPGRKVGQDSIPSDKLDTSVPAVEVEDHNIKMVDGTDTSDQAAGLIVSRGQPTNILEASIASLPPLKESGPDTTSVSPPASPAISKASGRLLDSDQRLTSPTAVSAARSSPAVQSSTTKGDAALDSDSELTSLNDSSDEGESEIDPDESEEEPLAKVVAKKKPPRVRLIVRPPPTAPVATVCGTNRCQNLLYPTSRWKLCDPCRSYFRRYQRKRREGTEEGQPRHHNEQAGDSPVMPLFSEIRATEMRICTIRGCGNVLLPLEEYRWKMCERCRSRTRDDAHTQRWGDAAVALPVASGDVVMADVEDEAAVPRKRPRADSGATKQQIAGHAATAPDGERSKYKKRKTKDKASDRQRVAKLQFSEASAYQHLPTLLETLQERFSSFMVAQAHYLRFKLMHRPEKDKMYPVLFAFDGEYSVVADPSGGPVDTLVRRIVLQVQSTVGMDFRPAGVITGPDWAVISKFSCVHELQIPVPLPAPDPDPESPDTPTKESIGIMLKQMVGELEIIVAWDRRHRRIPGQRFVIRLRLLG